MPAWLQIILIAALPIIELRGALPIALTVHGFAPLSALALSVIGNLLPVPFIFLLLDPAVKFVGRRSPAAHRLIERYFHHLKHKHKERFERLGALALLVFVAIPLPGTGAWTGSVLSVLFGIRFAYAVPAIAAGVLTSGIIVLALTTGITSIF